MRQLFPCKKIQAGIAALFFVFFTAASLPAQNGEGIWTGWFIGVAQVNNVKLRAIETKRPLLAVVGSGPCAHCNSLYHQVLLTDTFRAFAEQHQIVLFSCHNSASLPIIFKRLYGAQCNITSVFPHVYIFEILEGADTTTPNASAFDDPAYVHLLDAGASKPNRYSGFNYTPGERINNIQIEGEEDKWTPETFIQIFKSFFPNANGVELVPGPTHTGYENAIDFGRIPNTANPPPSAEEWIKNSGPNRLTPTATQNWFKFQGDLGKRYVFSATGIGNSNPGAEVTFELFGSELKVNEWVPLKNAHQAITSPGFDALERGIQVDMPAGTATNQTYFVRISTTKSINATYTLRIHEAPRAPAAGSVTNPHWNDAKPGQWTMNRGAAEAAAKANDKPILYLFGGLLWNSETVCMVHKVLETENFAKVIGNQANVDNKAYLVVLDNRERDGTGPSLPRADLDDNIEVQDALALPGAGGKIDYPTLVYRVRKANDLVSVGRISKDYNAATVVAKLNDLKAMAADGFVEDNNYADLTTQVLEDGVQEHSRIGGSLITADWWRFTVPDDDNTFATITATGAPDGAIINLAVYAADNTETPLKTATGTAGKSVSLDFVPAENPGGTRNPTAPEYLLQVTSTGANASFPYTLKLEEKTKSYVLAMADKEIKVSKQNVMDGRPVDLRLNIDTFTGNNDDITFNCRLLSQDGTVLRLLPITIPHGDKATPYTFNITLPKNIEYPNGAITELTAELIESDEDGNCQIDPKQYRTTINVYGYATFDYPQEATIDLYKNVAITPGTLCFPIIGGAADENSLAYNPTGVPLGLKVEYKTNDENNPYVEITGTPENEAKHEYKLRLILIQSSMQYTDLTFNIEDLPQVKNTFAGYLVKSAPVNQQPGSTRNDVIAAAQDILGDIKIDNELDKINKKILVRVATQDTIAPSLFKFTAWSSYSPGSPGKQGSVTLTGKAIYDDSTLELQVCLDDGTCTGTYTLPLGNSLAIHAKAVTEEPEQYAGYYTVALREADTTTRSLRGWLQVWVDDDGLATYSGELIDGTAFGPKTTYITPGELLFGHQSDVPNGELTFFLPLGEWTEQNPYPGRLAGRLSIVSLAERQQQPIVFPWISVCDDDYYSVWEKSANDSILLAPCGTVFESTLPVAEQVNPPNPPNFYIKVEPAPPETSFPPGTALPNYVKLKENRDASTMEVVDEGGILSAELGDLEYDAGQGTFIGAIKVLKTADGSANGKLTRTPCTIRGILTPNTSCCTVDTLEVGYGYFIDDGTTYLVTILNPSYDEQRPKKTAAPTISAFTPGGTRAAAPDQACYISDSDDNTVQLGVPRNAQIFRRQVGTQEIFLHTAAAGANELTIDSIPASRQEFTAQEAGKAESDKAILRLYRQNESLVTFKKPGDDPEENPLAEVVQLHLGWNLIGIPQNFRHNNAGVAAASFDAPANVDLFTTYDPDKTAYILAKILTAGNAYWIFVHNDTESFPLPGVLLLEEDYNKKSPGDNAWQFIVAPGEAQGTRWFWEDGKFSTDPPEQPTWRGVWYYYQKQP